MSLLTLLVVSPFRRGRRIHTYYSIHLKLQPTSIVTPPHRNLLVPSFLWPLTRTISLIALSISLLSRMSHSKWISPLLLHFRRRTLLWSSMLKQVHIKLPCILWHLMYISIDISLNQEVSGRSIFRQAFSMILSDGIIWPLGTWELHVWSTPSGCIFIIQDCKTLASLK